MQFAVLASGSNANATIVMAGDKTLLIDCGLSARALKKRMTMLGLQNRKIDAVFVTHEHRDHCIGLETFLKTQQCPLYFTRGTRRALRLENAHKGEEISAGESFFCFSGIKVGTFPISHDATEPIGFTFQYQGLSFGIATDMGTVTDHVRSALTGLNAFVLESNHNEDLLWACDYPWNLKQRIASLHGHLSNAQAATFLKELCHPGLMHVILGHLSANSNTPEVALAESLAAFGGNPPFELHVASRSAPSALFDLTIGERGIPQLQGSRTAQLSLSLAP